MSLLPFERYLLFLNGFAHHRHSICQLCSSWKWTKANLQENMSPRYLGLIWNDFKRGKIDEIQLLHYLLTTNIISPARTWAPCRSLPTPAGAVHLQSSHTATRGRRTPRNCIDHPQSTWRLIEIQRSISIQEAVRECVYVCMATCVQARTSLSSSLYQPRSPDADPTDLKDFAAAAGETCRAQLRLELSPSHEFKDEQ